MTYDRSLAIERRLGDVLELIEAGKYSSSDIADRLDVSVPTVSRDLMALRERGHEIRSERHCGGWRYVLGNRRPRAAESLNGPPGRRTAGG